MTDRQASLSTLHLGEHDQHGITIARKRCCAVCGVPGDQRPMEQHHVFGRPHRVKIRVCRECHKGFHTEVDKGFVGDRIRAMVRTLAEVLA